MYAYCSMELQWHLHIHKDKGLQCPSALSYLLYTVECMVLYCKHIKALMKVQICYLQSILQIRWQGSISDVMIQLHWAGYIFRIMVCSKLPKVVFYADLCQCRESHGGQKVTTQECAEETYEKLQHLPKYLVRESPPAHWIASITDPVAEAKQQRIQRVHERYRFSVASSSFTDRCHCCCRSNTGLVAHIQACKRGLLNKNSQFWPMMNNL